VLAVNEAIAETVRTAYDVLNDTVKQDRKAAEQFRVAPTTCATCPMMCGRWQATCLGLARQLQQRDLRHLREALLAPGRRADDTRRRRARPRCPRFSRAEMERWSAQQPAPSAAPSPLRHPQHRAPHPAAHAAAHPAHRSSVSPSSSMARHTARAHTSAVARPAAPTGAHRDQPATALPPGAAAVRSPITGIGVRGPSERAGLRCMVTVPQDQPSRDLCRCGRLHHADRCRWAQLVIEVD
jgi:hypothetical protein